MLGGEFALYLFGHPFWSFHKVKAAWDPVVEMFEKKIDQGMSGKGLCKSRRRQRTLLGKGWWKNIKR